MPSPLSGKLPTTLATHLWGRLCSIAPRTMFTALAPRASLHRGGAGVVWFALERARLMGDREGLERAASWLAFILRDAERDEEAAFLHERGAFDLDTLKYGVLTGLGGLAYVELLLGKASGDRTALGRGEERLVRAWQGRKRGRPPLELFAGVAGYTAVVRDLACRGIVTTALSAIADEAYERLVHGLRARIAAGRGGLGAAHGVVGQLLGALAWRPEPNAVIRARLDELVAIVRVEEGFVAFPALGGGPAPLWPSFCNGIPGAAILFDRAARAFGDPHYARMAALAANTTHALLQPVASLCCGTAGQSVALQHHARAAKAPRFRRRALTRLRQAARHTQAMLTHRPPALLADACRRDLNLWQGSLGVAAVELFAEHHAALTFPALLAEPAALP